MSIFTDDIANNNMNSLSPKTPMRKARKLGEYGRTKTVMLSVPVQNKAKLPLAVIKEKSAQYA